MARKRWGVLAALAGFVLALVVGLVPGTTRTAWAMDGQSYGLWVGDVEVTEANKDDVLKDGTVSFTPADDAQVDSQATLKLSGASITTGKKFGIFYQGLYDLNIELEKANSIELGDDTTAGIYSQGYNDSPAEVAILGTGSLSVSGPKFAVQVGGNLKVAGGEVTANGAADGAGIYSVQGGITITGGHLEASGMVGIEPGQGEKDLTIEGGEVIAWGTDAAIFGTVKNAVAGTGWSDVDGTAGEVAITVNTDPGWQKLGYKRVQFPALYPLWVGGVRVTAANATDVFQDGTVSYVPATDDDPAKLTLNGYTFDGTQSDPTTACGIKYEGEAVLSIDLEGESSVRGSESGIYSKKAGVFLVGAGSVSAVGGSHGIASDGGDVRVEGATVSANAGDADGGERGIVAFAGDVVVASGTVTAGNGSCGSGIEAANRHKVEIGDATVVATGSGTGIYTAGEVQIGSGATLTATGNEAISGTVKNAIAGTGWSDVDGTAGEVAITVNTDPGWQQLGYKRVQFPEVYPLWVGGVRATPANSGDLPGNHWTFEPAAGGANATLTLENYFDYDYDVTSEHEGAGIYWAGDGPLDIVTGASNEVCGSAFGVWGKSSITFRGDGTLTTAAGGEPERWGETDQTGQGIHAGGDLTAEGSTNVTALGPECGVHADGSVLLGGDSMSATSDKTAIVGSAVTVKRGRVEAKCTGRVTDGSAGIRATGRVAIDAGEVDAGDRAAVGIEAQTGVTVGNNVASVRARGTDRAIASPSVKNLVPGAGWADVAALADRTLIAVSAEGQPLDFRRVEFPFVVVAHKVTAKAEPAEGGTAKAGPAEAGKGEAVKLYAEPADGYEFVKWSVEGAGASIDDATSPKATLTMGTADVTVTANFKKKSAPAPTVAKAAKPKTVAYPSKGRVDVSWKAAKGAKSYQLQWRKAGAKKWTTASVKGRSKKVTGLKAGACYEFRVRGVNGKVRGKWSSASLRWLKGAAKAKAATGKSKGTIKATWKADKAATGGFKVFVYSKKGGKVVKTKVVKAGATSATVKGLKSGKTYYVRVRPYRAQGGSTYYGAISGYRAAKAK